MLDKNKYLTTLIKIAKDEIPQLNYDITNASTLFTQQKCLERLTVIVTYLLHHAILNSGAADVAVPAVQAVAAPPPGSVQGIAPSSVPEVVVTAEGTHVIPPGGAGNVVTAPPGVPIDATFGRTTESGGVQEVFLPPGGAPASQ